MYKNKGVKYMNEIQVEQKIPVSQKKYLPSFVVSVVGAIFAFISPLASWICGILALVLALTKRRRKEFEVQSSIILSIVALCIGLLNYITTLIIISDVKYILNYIEMFKDILDKFY